MAGGGSLENTSDNLFIVLGFGLLGKAFQSSDDMYPAVQKNGESSKEDGFLLGVPLSQDDESRYKDTL